MKPPKPCRDHLGQEYPSMSAMAKAWGIDDATLQNRLKRMSLEQALTADHNEAMAVSRGTTDHLGNPFPSKAAMCRHWGIPSHVFFGRIRCGWTLEQALTLPIQDEPSNTKQVTDHTGTTFSSVSAMCRHWGVKRSTYNIRIAAGWSMKDALSKDSKPMDTAPKTAVDHLGQEFPSINAMCRHWGTTKDTLRSRMERGWTLEQALEHEGIIPVGKECRDYMGRTFPSVSDLCWFYGLREYDLRNQKTAEDPFRKALEKRYCKGSVFGHAEILRPLAFPYFLIAINSMEYIWNLEQLLDEYHRDFLPTPAKRLKMMNVQILEQTGILQYRIEFDGTMQDASYWDIMDLERRTNFGLHKSKQKTGGTDN